MESERNVHINKKVKFELDISILPTHNNIYYICVKWWDWRVNYEGGDL